jgi:hypothetical protein
LKRSETVPKLEAKPLPRKRADDSMIVHVLLNVMTVAL